MHMRPNDTQYNNNRAPPQAPSYALPLATISNTQNPDNFQSTQPLTTNQYGRSNNNETTQKHEEMETGDNMDDVDQDDNVRVRAHTDCEGIGDDELFEGSTHHFAVYFAEKRNVSGLIISYFVFSLQLILYSICAHKELSDFSGDDMTIPVKIKYGKDCKISTKNFVCAPPGLPVLTYTAVAAVLLAFFLMHDIVAGIRVLTSIPGKWAKFAGFVIVFEALFAAMVGALFAAGAEDGYDAIANCIGVLFIHDADEKAYEAFQVINADQLKSSRCCKNKCCSTNKWWSKIVAKTRLAALFLSAFIIMLLALMVATVARKAQEAHIYDIYGPDSKYAHSDWFGDYDYDYYWWYPSTNSTR